MIAIHPEIQEALDQQRPIVALESTVITHGLPRPDNLKLAQALEQEVRDYGAIPATIAIIDGRAHIGLNAEQLVNVAEHEAHKASLWNLATLLATQQLAGTTVATTLHLAAQVGIRCFATGGIGGVHDEAFDESADLLALARYPLITVCAGPKSILNVGATIERLESLGVPLIGYQSDYLAGFHVSESSHKVPTRCDNIEEIASSFLMQQRLGLQSAILVAQPVSQGLDAHRLAGYLQQAKDEAQAAKLSGKDITPFLLARLATLSDGQSVAVNVRLLKENARLAARIAQTLATKEVVMR